MVCNIDLATGQPHCPVGAKLSDGKQQGAAQVLASQRVDDKERTWVALTSAS